MPFLLGVNMEIEMKIKQLQDENEALRCRNKEAESRFSDMVELQNRIKVLESNIQLLKGQIEAYQFCIKNGR